jgi:integrase
MAKQINDQRIKSLIKQGAIGRYAVGSGLYFRISKEGTGFWLFKYTHHSKRKELSIGRYPEMSLGDATVHIVALRKQLGSGKDPQVEKSRESANPFKTVDDLANDWLIECEKRLKHPQIPRRVYTKDISPIIGHISLSDIKALDVRGVINKIIDRPSISNDALMYMKQLFRHGLKLDVINGNPADAFRPADAGGVEKSRDRRLTSSELNDLFKAINTHMTQFCYENWLAVQLLLLLGVRKSELLAATWDEFDVPNAVWTIPPERTKTESGYRVPLTDMVLDILSELKVFARGAIYVFPARRKSKRNGHVSPDTLNAALLKLLAFDGVNIPHFTVHDLRRTFRSLLSELKVPGKIAEMCLNHKLKGVEGTYDRYDYFDERKDALIQLKEHFQKVLASSLVVA